MNIFEKMDSALHTFGAWAEKELGALHNAAPALEQTAATILKYAGAALQTVVTAEAGGAAGALVGKVVADVQAGLTAAAGFIYDYGATPTAASLTGSVVSNLSGLLAAGKVTNATSVATITSVVTNLNNLTTALTAAEPAASSSSTASS
jgi:hypothetical protein